MKTLVSIVGTNRPDNYTTFAARLAGAELEKRGYKVKTFLGTDLNLSFPGQPESKDGQRLKKAVETANGILLATPEYHGTYASFAKLVIENLGFPSKLSGKPVALLGTAAGRIGAIKSLEQLKGVCSHVGALVIPGSLSVAGVRQVFDESGNVQDKQIIDAINGFCDSIGSFMQEFVAPKLTLESMVRDPSSSSWSSQI